MAVQRCGECGKPIMSRRASRPICGPCKLRKVPLRAPVRALPPTPGAPVLGSEPRAVPPASLRYLGETSGHPTGRRDLAAPTAEELAAAIFPPQLPDDMGPCPALPEPFNLYRDPDPARCLVALGRLLAMPTVSRRGKPPIVYSEDHFFTTHLRAAYDDLVAATSKWPRQLNRTLFDRTNWVSGVLKPRIVLDMEITAKDNFSLTWRPEPYLVSGNPRCDFTLEPRTRAYFDFDRPAHELLFIHDVGHLRIDIPPTCIPPDAAKRQIDGYLLWVLSRILATLLEFLRENFYVRVARWLEVVEAKEPSGQLSRSLVTWRIYDVEVRQLAEDQGYEANFGAQHGIHQDDLLELYAGTAGRSDRFAATCQLLRRRNANMTPARVRDCILRLQANAMRRRRADQRRWGRPVDPDEDELERPRVHAW